MMQEQNWRVLAERVLLEKRPWMRVIEQTVALPDGRVIDDFLKIESPPYCSVFGLRPDGLVVAVEEYKHGPERVVIKLPAGFIEPGETPLAGAKRELLEEAGYEAEDWTFLGKFSDDGNRGMSEGHHFLATGLHQVAEPNANDLSEVKPILLTVDEICEAVRSGRVGESGTAAGILLALDALAG